MKFVKYTYVDAQTNVCVNKAPARSGPKEPEIKGLKFIFAAERKYPTNVPEFFGICDDDADLGIDGCFGEITEAEFIVERHTEINARKKYASWVVNQAVWDDPFAWLNDLWSPPVAYPDDGKFYEWDEASTSWQLISSGNSD
jgi:hypothetical protein